MFNAGECLISELYNKHRKFVKRAQAVSDNTHVQIASCEYLKRIDTSFTRVTLLPRLDPN